jgi:hypothetical protein
LKTVDEEGNTVDLTLKDVLFVPKFGTSLLSVNSLIAKNVSVNFNKFGCKLALRGTVLGIADRCDDLFKLRKPKERACNVWRSGKKSDDIFGSKIQKLGSIEGRKVGYQKCLSQEERIIPESIKPDLEIHDKLLVSFGNIQQKEEVNGSSSKSHEIKNLLNGSNNFEGDSGRSTLDLKNRVKSDWILKSCERLKTPVQINQLQPDAGDEICLLFDNFKEQLDRIINAHQIKKHVNDQEDLHRGGMLDIAMKSNFSYDDIE